MSASEARRSRAMPSVPTVRGRRLRQRPNRGIQRRSAFPLPADWEFAFTDSAGKPDSEANAPAHFTADANHVEGTIAPISGDYGMLAGALPSGADAEFHLSRFDGVHALRLDGQFVSPDRIEGVFHVAPGRPLNFVATRSSTSPGFEEAERLTSVENPSEPFRFHGRDASGATITQDDSAFRGKVALLDIFGTWCPNCHDEAPLLQWLYAKFHARGLEVVGLSYEYVRRHRPQPALARRLSPQVLDCVSLAAGWHDRLRRDRKNSAATAQFRRLSHHDFS